jgi:hypothetical protein
MAKKYLSSEKKKRLKPTMLSILSNAKTPQSSLREK